MPVTHARNEEWAAFHPDSNRPECSSRGLMLIFAGPGEAITCKLCIKATGMTVMPGEPKVLIDERLSHVLKPVEPEVDTSAVSSLGLKMLAKEQRVRVVQVSRYEADLNGTQVMLERRTVIFKGSWSAYLIWTMSNIHMGPDYKVEFGTKGTWDTQKHVFDGFKPVNSQPHLADMNSYLVNKLKRDAEDKLRNVIEWSPTPPVIDDHTAEMLASAEFPE
jgi:hypothetical protein